MRQFAHTRIAMLLMGVVLGIFVPGNSQLLGNSIPQPIPEPISSDTVINGVVICGGLSGEAVLTMGNEDTLFVLGDADFTGISLSDPMAGTIIIAGIATDNNPVRLVTLDSLEVNNLGFLAVPNLGSLRMEIQGNYLKANGTITRYFSRSWRHIKFGTEEQKLNLVVKGGMLLEHFQPDAIVPTPGWPGTARNQFYADSLVFYGDVTMHTWYTYNGVNGATLYFSGSEKQTIGLGTMVDQGPYYRDNIRENRNNRDLATVIHNGSGILELKGAPFTCEKFIQAGGPLSMNGSAFGTDSLIFSGKLINDVPWSGSTVGGEIVAYKHAEFRGTEQDSVDLNPAQNWIMRSFGSVLADHAIIGNSTIMDEFAQGIAFNSRDAGGNTRWIFVEEEKVLFSRGLPDTLVVNTLEEVIWTVATVAAPSVIGPVTYSWKVDGQMVENVTNSSYAYTSSAEPQDNGKAFMVYAHADGEVIDSSGPAILKVLDRPRMDGLKGQSYGIFGDINDTLKIYPEVIAGVDSLRWFVVTQSGGEMMYTPLQTNSDTLMLSLDSTFLGGKRLAVIGYDNDPQPLAPDTVSKLIRADELRYTMVNQVDSVEIGASVNYTIEVTEWTGQDSLSFEWFLDGNKVPGETSATLALPSITAEQTGSYTGEIVISGRKENVTAVEATVWSPTVSLVSGLFPDRLSFVIQKTATGLGIRIAVPDAGKLSFTVHQFDGKVLYKKQGVYQKGIHTVPMLTGSVTKGTGLIIRVETKDKSISRKFIPVF